MKHIIRREEGQATLPDRMLRLYRLRQHMRSMRDSENTKQQDQRQICKNVNLNAKILIRTTVIRKIKRAMVLEQWFLMPENQSIASLRDKCTRLVNRIVNNSRYINNPRMNEAHNQEPMIFSHQRISWIGRSEWFAW